MLSRQAEDLRPAPSVLAADVYAGLMGPVRCTLGGMRIVNPALSDRANDGDGAMHLKVLRLMIKALLNSTLAIGF